MAEGKESVEARPMCAGCGLAIRDDTHIAAMEKLFHKACFVCFRCKNAFDGGTFFEHDGQPYCRSHHLSLFCEPCAKCKQPVEAGVTLEGRTYHLQHFVCDDCGASLEDQEVVQLAEDGGLYCEEHFVARFAPKCSGCSKPLEGDVIQALGTSFHAQCFRCAGCSEVLQAFCDRDGEAFCAACFSDKFTPKSTCSGCGEPIPHDAKMEAFDSFWHRECLKCCVCQEVFTTEATMFSVGAKVYCEPHYVATLERCFQCVKPITGEFFTLDPELLWKRELRDTAELVCEEHSKGPLTEAVVARVLAAAAQRASLHKAAFEEYGSHTHANIGAVFTPSRDTTTGADSEGGATSTPAASGAGGAGAGAAAV